MPPQYDRRKGEFEFLIPRRGVAYRRVHGPIAGWIIGEEDIRQNRVTQIAGGCPEGQSGCYLVNLICRAEHPDSLFVVRDDALDKLEGQAESPPRIVLEKRNENGAIKTERVPDGMLLHDLVPILTARSGLETRQCPGGAVSSGKLGDVVELIGIKEQFSPDRRVEGNAGELSNRVIKLAGKKARSIIHQPQVDHGPGPEAPELEYLVRALRVKSPDVAQAYVQGAEIVCDPRAELPAIAGVGQLPGDYRGAGAADGRPEKTAEGHPGLGMRSEEHT